MSQNAQQLVPVILSGGSGTRLWPLSREKYPKQLLSLIDNETLLQSTALRLAGLTLDIAVSDRPIVVCNQEYRFITAEQLLQVGVVTERIILEPFGKNTAPALTLAAQTICADGSDAVLLAMAADHAMQNIDAFHTAIANGLPAALDGHVVTFGVTPNTPATGYDYVQANGLGQYPNVLGINQFVEKPDVTTAQAYLDSGEYLWNSGIFMVKASSWLQAMAHYAPEILLACDAAVTNAAVDLDFVRLNDTAFSACPSVSIGYAVMGKLSLTPDGSIKGYVVPMDAGWSDVGAWDTVWQVLDKDQNGNVAQGDALFVKTTNSLVLSHDRVVSCLGLDDMVIIDTVDALLVAKKSEVQDLKSVVAAIKKTHAHLTDNHRKVFRPWGAYDSIAADERFQVKRIIVKPGASLSLQMHHHRAEHWIVVRGTGRVTRGDEVFLLSENESTFIPLGVVHRLENPGKTTLELIEVQSGAYLGEDDIVRLEDVYGRDGSNG